MLAARLLLGIRNKYGFGLRNCSDRCRRLGALGSAFTRSSVR
jgi:hypothetical protein